MHFARIKGIKLVESGNLMTYEVATNHWDYSKVWFLTDVYSILAMERLTESLYLSMDQNHVSNKKHEIRSLVMHEEVWGTLEEYLILTTWWLLNGK